ncbi:hypothetical protein PIB30_060529 [Stylosanthes scabra]|uniref:Uncharacterized protein n=1 Tax=Stylosanthes scabra TaxID=79078 RepID=A0ABU6VJ05_9FABA|nr:hypothetical protein [Stylosanthes scabra]
MEVDTMDAILAQNKAMAQQLTTLNMKLEKLEVAAIGTQEETTTICGLCGGPHENQHCYLIMQDQPLEKVTWKTSRGSLMMILLPTFITPDGGTTLILVGEETKIPRTTTSKTTHLTNHFTHHLFHNQLPYHLYLNLNHLKLILRQPWKSLP